MNLIALIFFILILIGLIFYHIKYKKPFIKYEDNIYEKMVSLRFYFMLVFVILCLIYLEFKGK